MFNTIWYDSLTKPLLNPPAWIFPPVWIILYATLFIALIIYAIKITKVNKLQGYVLFIIHMLFNIIWSPIFFIFHKINVALVIIIILDITAILIIKKFFSVSKLSGGILLTYLAWILFATYLNYEIYILN